MSLRNLDDELMCTADKSLVEFDLSQLPENAEDVTVHQLVVEMAKQLKERGVHGTNMFFDMEHETPDGETMRISVAFTAHE